MSVKKILISQSQPKAASPYDNLKEKYGTEFDFVPFFKTEPVSSREFRAEKINILDYTAVVFSARTTIDAFFHLCEELRVKIPETMKYFCTTELVANYLQKHIVYRKRKIFYGNGTPESVIGLVGTKHKDETFLIAISDSGNKDAITSLFEKSGLKYATGVFVKSVPQDLSGIDFKAYSAVMMFNPADVKSLFVNFPEFKQEDLKFISYGKSVKKALDDAGIAVEIAAPNETAPSIAKAIEVYLEAQK